jgi:hypothetical protein
MKLYIPFISKLISFYYDGFRNMSEWGNKVWLIIIIKLFIIFAVLKLFFFPDFLNRKFQNDDQRSKYVLENLTNSNTADD